MGVARARPTRALVQLVPRPRARAEVWGRDYTCTLRSMVNNGQGGKDAVRGDSEAENEVTNVLISVIKCILHKIFSVCTVLKLETVWSRSILGVLCSARRMASICFAHVVLQ